LNQKPVYVAAAGIVSPLGSGLAETEAALRANRSAIGPLEIFPLLQGSPLPVGQVRELAQAPIPPRAHRLARMAAQMALADCPDPPDAIILGCTTGGILTTEELLREGERNRDAYQWHGLFSLAEDIAALCRCTGPALTVSTACSSGAMAIALALNLLQTGRMRCILAGGVDSLSRLTYFGFHSLQLVDRNGCRPLDADRQGLAVAEGAGMLLLTTERPQRPLATLLGAGLSCDAHHPTAPHPEGKGARAAMLAALEDLNALPLSEKGKAMETFLALVRESGDSSWELLQNVFSAKHPDKQGVTLALALTRKFLASHGASGACRVHGGGFAGTIQAYLPLDCLEEYRKLMDEIFGKGALTVLRIRSKGAIELEFQA